MLPHFQHVFVPLKMQAGYGNAVGIFHFGIEIDVIRIRAQAGSLNSETYGRGIAALDLALVGRSEAVEFVGDPGKISAAAVGVDGVATNKFFFVRIFQILPARHPGDGAVADVVGERGTSYKLRKISTHRLAVKVIAKVAAELSAGVGNTVGV